VQVRLPCGGILMPTDNLLGFANNIRTVDGGTTGRIESSSDSYPECDRPQAQQN